MCPAVLRIFPASLAFKLASQSVIYLSPSFNAKIVFSSLLHFLIPACFEEKPKETFYSNFLIFAAWKLYLRVEIQRALAASFASKTRFLHAALREGYLTKIMHVFTLYFPESCQALRAVGKEASFCQLNNGGILLMLADSSAFQIGADLPSDLVWAQCFQGDSPCPAESNLSLLPHSSYSCSEQRSA